MTPDVAWRMAAAFGLEIQASTGNLNPLIVIGRDSRPSSEMLGAAAVAGLFAVGCRVMRLGCVSTPTVSVMLHHYKAQGGMVITASHNPIQWNGLKCLNTDGVAPPAADAERIIARFKANDITQVAGDVMQPMQSDLNGDEIHVLKVLEHLGTDQAQKIRAQRFKVVLDSVNGAGCVAGKMLLELLGCEVVHLNGEPTGHFAHTPEPTKENLTALADAVPREQAHVGFAQDPDADRLAVVDDTGRYIGEEYTLVLSTEAVLQSLGEDAPKATVGTNLSTSRMMDDACARHGATLIRSAVGEANVVEAMKQNASACGGEGNGGIIWPPVTYVRDSLSGMALVLSLLANQGQSLSTIINDWPTYTFVKTKIGIKPGLADRAIAAMAERFGAHQVDMSDGIRIDLQENNAMDANLVAGSWVHVRASNTEPILRILVEAPTDADAQALVDVSQAVIAQSDNE